MKPLTMIVVTDLHLGSSDTAPSGDRRSDLTSTLLERVIARANRPPRPDLLLLLGDLVDQGNAPEAWSHYRLIADTLRRVEARTLVLPGNHDGSAFFDVFPRPGIADCAGFRLACFLDPEEPGWNARRDASGFALMREARRGHQGPIVALQHVPVFPPGLTDCPYGYLNTVEVIEAMREHGIHLALAGHYHAGSGPVTQGETSFSATAALCEAPFSFDTVRTDGVTVSVERHTLGSPEPV